MKMFLLIMCVLVSKPVAVLAEASELQVESTCAPPIEGRAMASVDACRALAEAGSARAAYYMGIHHERDDWKEAEAWFLRASEIGFPPASRRLEYVHIARSQGRLEIFLAGGAVLILSAALAFICRRSDRRVCRHSILMMAPWYAVIAFALLSKAGGSWGALKHPWLHEIDPGIGTLSAIAALALLAVPLHLFVLKEGAIRRKYVFTSLAVFGVATAVAIVFLMFLAGLASQGAGK